MRYFFFGKCKLSCDAVNVVKLWLLWVCSVVADLFVNKNGVKFNYHLAVGEKRRTFRKSMGVSKSTDGVCVRSPNWKLVL